MWKMPRAFVAVPGVLFLSVVAVNSTSGILDGSLDPQAWLLSVVSAFGGAFAIGIVMYLIPGVLNGTPVIVKELLEQAARKRNWWMRVVYSTLAFLAAFSIGFEILHRSWGNKFAILGQGRELFSMFVGLQFFGIYFFMPAMTSTLLTAEKERDTLSLLFLTKLNPWGIIFGKFISRLLPMLLFIGLSMPLFSFAYSMGGFEHGLIWSAIWLLSVTTIQVGVLGLMCSAWFRTTTGAFIAAYLLGFLMLFGPLIFDEWTGLFQSIHRTICNVFGVDSVFGFDQRMFSSVFFAPMIIFGWGPWSASVSDTLIRTIPIVSLTTIMLMLTRTFIVRRAFVENRNILLVLFRKMDRFFWTMNTRFGRGITLTKGSSALPDDQPVAWRETSKKTLGTFRYLLRVFIALEFPVVFICANSVSLGHGGLEMVSVLLIFMWIIAVLLVCVASTSLIAAERSHQTLDVLLSTPMKNAELLKQKSRGVLRLMFVVAIPLLTIYGFETWLRFDLPELGRSLRWRQERVEFPVLCYALTGFGTVLVYLPMVAAMAFLIGMKVKNQARAITATLGVLVGWCIVPLLILMPFMVVFDLHRETWGELVTVVSPMMIIPFNEFMEHRHPWIALLLNSGIYGGATIALCTYAAFNFNGLLGRTDSQRDTLVVPPPNLELPGTATT